MKSFFRRLLKRTGWKPHNRRKEFFDDYFSKIERKNFFFVQIGAGDGKLADPLYPYVMKHQLKGLAVEPLPAVFPRLRETYKEQPQVRCIQAALAEHSGEMTLYTPHSDDPALATLASLDRAVLEKTLRAQHNGAGVGIAEHRVRALSFADLVAQEKLEHIDLIQIDCEGYDWKVLQQVDLQKWQPSLINFESALLSEEDKRASRAYLEQNGYSWFEHGLDTCAYKA